MSTENQPGPYSKVYTPSLLSSPHQPERVLKFWIDQSQNRTNGTQFVEKITVKRDGGEFVAKAYFEKGWLPESTSTTTHDSEDGALAELTEKLRNGITATRQESGIVAIYKPERRVFGEPELVRNYYENQRDGPISTTPFVTEIVVKGDGVRFTAKAVFDEVFDPRSAIESDPNEEHAIRKLIEKLRAGVEATRVKGTYKPGKKVSRQPDLVQKYFEAQRKRHAKDPTTRLVEEIVFEKDGRKFKAEGVFEEGCHLQSAVAESNQDEVDAIGKLIKELKAVVKATHQPSRAFKVTYKPGKDVSSQPDLVQKYFEVQRKGPISTTPFVTKIVVKGDGGKFEAKGVFDEGLFPQSADAESDQNEEDAIGKLIETLRAGVEAKPRAPRAIRSAK